MYKAKKIIKIIVIHLNAYLNINCQQFVILDQFIQKKNSKDMEARNLTFVVINLDMISF